MADAPGTIDLRVGRDSWRVSGASDAARVAVKGGAWVRGRYVEGDELLEEILTVVRCDGIGALCAFAPAVHGLFAVVAADREGGGIALVDRMRSVPLFWRCESGEWSIADAAGGAAGGASPCRLDQESADELLMTGFVCGSATLFRGVNQVEAGSMVRFRRDEAGRVRATVERYDEFLRDDDAEDDDRNAWMDRLERSLDATIERLAASSRGRRLVVPLSGGVDSRLIVAGLRRHGVTNVLCFTYWPRGHWEVEVSRRVAAGLGYEWHHVPCGRLAMRRAFAAPGYDEFVDFASRGAGGVVFQDWLAVATLASRGVLAEGDLVVPGHTGDFIAGKQSPEKVLRSGGATRHSGGWSVEALSRAIFAKHYRLWGGSTPPTRFERWGGRIRSMLPPLGEPLDDASLVRWFDWWNWKERQCKYIVNSCRNYEWFGFGWRVPLWDKPMWDLWQRVPLALRDGGTLYDEVATRRFFQPLGIDGADFRMTGRPDVLSSTLDPRLAIGLSSRGGARLAAYLGRLGWCRAALPFARSTSRETQVNAAIALELASRQCDS